MKSREDKSYALVIAEAVYAAVLDRVGDLYLDTCPASQVKDYLSPDLPSQVVASIPAPDPIYQWRERMTPLWEDCGKAMFDRLSTLESYETRVIYTTTTGR